MCFRKSRSEGGLKNDPIRRGGVDFFWNNPLQGFIWYDLYVAPKRTWDPSFLFPNLSSYNINNQ